MMNRSLFAFVLFLSMLQAGGKLVIGGKTVLRGPAPPGAASVTFAISTASTTNATSYATGSFTPASGDLLQVDVVATGTVDTTPYLVDSTGEITSFTLAGSSVKASSVDTTYSFFSDSATTSATARTITFNCPAAAASGAVVTVYRVTLTGGRVGSFAIKQVASQSNQAAASTPAPVFGSAVTSANAVIGVVGNATNPATMTPPTGFVEDADNGYATPTTGSETVHSASGFTGTTVTWGSTSASAFDDFATEIDSSPFTLGNTVTHVSSTQGNGSTSSGNFFTFTITPAATNHAFAIAVFCNPGTGVRATSITLTSPGWTVTNLQGPIAFSTLGALGLFGAISPDTSTDTFTATFVGATDCSSFDAQFISEFSGTDTTGGATTFESSDGGTATGLPGCRRTVSPTHNNDALFGFCVTGGATPTVGGYFTQGAAVADLKSEYRVNLRGGNGYSIPVYLLGAAGGDVPASVAVAIKPAP